jgi:pyruvate kinase
LNNAIKLKTPKELLLKSAVYLSDDIPRCAIAVFTKRGNLARTLSTLRPRKSTIFAFTDNEDTFQKLLLYWGVEPFLMRFNSTDPEETIQSAFSRLRSRGWVQSRDNMVMISNIFAGEKLIDTIQLRTIP